MSEPAPCGGGNSSSKTAVTTEMMLAGGSAPITPGESGSSVDVDAGVDGAPEPEDKAAFERLTMAWDAASGSVRHRFVVEVVEPFGQLNVAA
jgi:hypothetical protein